jgi:hypothetical protein
MWSMLTRGFTLPKEFQSWGGHTGLNAANAVIERRFLESRIAA